jgi:guanosine-3',5'-bis(diphosphate) 3'-pyrophosphohydrolase
MTPRAPADLRPVLDAIAFAARAHHGQFRKDRETPYVSHVFRVCFIVRDLFGFDDARMLLAAILHDTIEDTTTDCDDISERYGPEVARWVGYLTKDKRLPDDERERGYIDGLLQAPWEVQVCKLADIFDNLSDLPQLPKERRGHALARAEQYFAALQQVQAAEVRRPLALVQQLIEQARQEVASNRGG